MTKNRFPWGWLTLFVAIAAAVYWGPGLFSKSGAGPGEQGGATAMPASVSTVITKDVRLWSPFSGRIEAVQSAEIRPQVSGLMEAVHFKDGEQVSKGQPLFTIDARPYMAELARAKGLLATAESARINATQDYARAQKLIKSGAISQSEFEARANALKQAIGNEDAADGVLRAALVNVEYTRVKAPISGKISRAEITAGNLVEAGPNAPLLASIVALSPIYAAFEIDEQTFLRTIQGVPAAKLKTIPVEVGLSGDEGTPIQATIHSFDNQLALGSGTIRVRALIANKDESLVPGLFAKVRISAAGDTSAILINPTAIGTDQNKKFVLLVGENTITEYREVQLGGMTEGLQVITEGLQEGDRIVVNGLQRLRPGAPVLPQPVDMRTLQPAEVMPAEPAVETPPTATP